MSAPLADIITDDVLQEARLARQLRETIARSGVDPEAVLAEVHDALPGALDDTPEPRPEVAEAPPADDAGGGT